MTPQEIKEIANAVNESNSGQDMVYIFISVMVVLTPILLWAGRIIFKKTISQVVEDSVQPQVDLVKELVDVRHQENKQLFNIMEMHIDELKHVKLEQNDIKERLDVIEKRR